MSTSPANSTVTLQSRQQLSVKILPGQHYQVRKAGHPDTLSDLPVPDQLVATRQGDSLHVRYADGSAVNFDGFYTACKDAGTCSVTLAGNTEDGITLASDMPTGTVPSGSDSTLVYAHGSHDVLMAMAQGQTEVQTAFDALEAAPVLTYLPPAAQVAASESGLALVAGVAALLASKEGINQVLNTGFNTGQPSTPSVTSVALNTSTGAQNKTLNAGDTINIAVAMSEATTVTGSPTLALHIGGSTVQAHYLSGSGTNMLLFSYTIQPGQNDANGISIDANSLSLNGGTLKNTAGTHVALTHSAVADNANYMVDTTAPTLGISSSASALHAGETATISFHFSEDPGTSFVASDITTTGGTLGALSGSGLTRTATFTPTANLGSGSASITVAAGSYADAAGNGGGAGSTPAISIDTLAPTLTISSNASALHAGETATITFHFSEDPGTSFVGGDITTTGGTVGAISGSGLTRTATFTPAANLASGSANISVAAGSYTDLAGNTGGGASAAPITLDTAAPSVVSVALTSGGNSQTGLMKAGNILLVTVTMSEGVFVSGTPTLALNIGGTTVQASYLAVGHIGVVPSSTTLDFLYTIEAGQNDANGISIDANSLSLAGGSITDAAGNTANLTHSAVADNANYMVDTTAPTLSISSSASALHAGETATISFHFSEDPGTSFVASDITTTGGTLGVLGGSGLIRTATFTPTANLGSGSASITVAAGSYADAAGNGGGAGSTPAISIDTLAPTVTSVALTDATGAMNNTLNAGDVVSATVTLSEATTVTGTPTLALVVGGSTVQAKYVSGSGTTALVFSYTIQGGDEDTNGIGIAANSLLLAGGTLKDAAGNDARLTHSAVADNANYLVDTAAQIATLNSYTANAGMGKDGTFLVGGTTDDTTPVLNGTLSSDLGSGGVVRILDGTTFLGNATLSGNTWTYATSALADGSLHSFTAVAVDAAGNVGGASQAIALAISAPFERLVNPSFTGGTTGWTLNPANSAVSYFSDSIGFNGGNSAPGASAYQVLTHLLVGQSYTVQYELGLIGNLGQHTMLASVQDGATWNAGTVLASDTYEQTSAITTLHSFTFTATSSTATVVFTNTATANTVNTDLALNQASVMLSSEAATRSATPLLLDLNGDGVQTVDLAHGVLFDVANTGVAKHSAWVSSTDGLLVRDINQDGHINNGAELFGQGTLLADGTHAANGFAALAQFDANHDGKIDAQDAVFKELKVWRDTNGDGVSQTGELHSLTDLGIVSFNLKAATGYAVENGNLHGLVSGFTTADGVVHALADVWLQQATVVASPVL